MVNGIFLGLGSNLGNRMAVLQAALDMLQASGIAILQRSAIYETPPWGNTDQPAFLNLVAKAGFEGSPMELLQGILSVEAAMGRERVVHWGPRIIDIDLLAFDDMIIRSQRLTVPHPLATERAFVLVPWAEIAPDFIFPGNGSNVHELCQRLPLADLQAIRNIESMK